MDIQSIVEQSSQGGNELGMIVVLEIMGAIPMQLALLEPLIGTNDFAAVLHVFQGVGNDVLNAVVSSSSQTNTRRVSLNSLEHWLVGCIPTKSNFGIGGVDIYERSAFETLFCNFRRLYKVLLIFSFI